MKKLWISVLIVLLASCEKDVFLPIDFELSDTTDSITNGRTLIYEDNFNILYGSYESWYDWGRNHPGELQYYTQYDSNKVCENGILTIEARKEPKFGLPYSSGMLSTINHIQFKYGLIIAKIKLYGGDGAWPAIWMFNVDDDGIHEIDIFEFNGASPHKISIDNHWGQSYSDESHSHDQVSICSDSFVDKWITVACDWGEDYLSWYINGKMIYRTVNRHHLYMPLIINMAINGNAYNESCPDTIKFCVDYIRVYSEKNK